jgi:D-sedoheptulose 7-phosphate isomerase
MSSYYQSYVSSMDSALRGLEITDSTGKSLSHEEGFELLYAVTRKVADNGLKQYLCGNGASASFANHMALDWTKNGGIPTHSYSDSALLTAMGNDLGYEEVFSAPLSWYAKPGDQLVAISSSGNSPNIVRTIGVAREKEMGVITFTGLKPDNTCRALGDLNLYIPAKTYGIVECAHQILLHVWLDQYMGICEWEREAAQNMRKDEYVG